MKRKTFRAAALFMAMMLLLCACGGDHLELPSESTAVAITPRPQSPANGDNAQRTETTEIKNLILIIGDGMGVEHISAARMCVDEDFCFTDWQYASSNTDSLNEDGEGAILTDSAASGTALATGCLTVNGYVGKNSNGRDLETVLDEAKRLGKATGIVTTDAIYGATPAAFSAHRLARTEYAEIAMSQLLSGVDLLCGTTDTLCTDRKNAIEAAGYRYCDSFSDVGATLTADRAYWQLPLAGSAAAVKLCQATDLALDFLSRDEDGFCLVIEQAHIDKYSHSNNFSATIQCVSDLNDTVNTVLEWIGDRTDTAVIVTADHETGGLSVSYQNRFANAYEGANATVYYEFSSVEHTNQDVGVFLYGVAVDLSNYSYSSHHRIKNADVYYIMCDIMNGVLY